MVRRSYEEFCTLDAHLHQCIYDRRYSKLAPLQPLGQTEEKTEVPTTQSTQTHAFANAS